MPTFPPIIDVDQVWCSRESKHPRRVVVLKANSENIHVRTVTNVPSWRVFRIPRDKFVADYVREGNSGYNTTTYV